jgi:hypothetical protein
LNERTEEELGRQEVAGPTFVAWGAAVDVAVRRGTSTGDSAIRGLEYEDPGPPQGRPWARTNSCPVGERVYGPRWVLWSATRRVWRALVSTEAPVAVRVFPREERGCGKWVVGTDILPEKMCGRWDCVDCR